MWDSLHQVIKNVASDNKIYCHFWHVHNFFKQKLKKYAAHLYDTKIYIVLRLTVNSLYINARIHKKYLIIRYETRRYNVMNVKN